MANIVWASGLQVTAAWYGATETDSALRAGSHVKGTVLLVCRKRQGSLKTTRDDLAWEIQEEVEVQVQALSGLNQEAKGLYRDEKSSKMLTSRWRATPPRSAPSPATPSLTAAT
jgi:putative DNA methylase